MENTATEDAFTATAELRRILPSQGLFVRAGYYMERGCLRQKDAGPLLQELAKTQYPASKPFSFVRRARALFGEWKKSIGNIEFQRTFLKTNLVWSTGGHKKSVLVGPSDGSTGACFVQVSVQSNFPQIVVPIWLFFTIHAAGRCWY